MTFRLSILLSVGLWGAVLGACSGATALASEPNCKLPFGPASTSGTSTKVGTGTAASCTEAALTTAVAKGGVIVFACGGSATITINSQIALPRAVDTVIDGNNLITLAGQGNTRIFHFDGGNYRTTKTTVTLQRLTISQAQATGTPIAAAPPPCAQGTQIDGGGGGILINDGILHVYDVTFNDNAAASLGPDVAGGAIYATGSLQVTVINSRFVGNSAANGGAIGSLNSDLAVYGSSFSDNKALGHGANSIDANCHVGGGEVGDGGNGGAVSIDGGSDGTAVFCGSSFTGNQGGVGALGGAIFRTPDAAMQTTEIDQCTFDSNQADSAGALYFHNTNLVLTNSTISNNQARGSALQADGTQLNLVNVTFANNVSSAAPGAAVSLFGNGGSLTNCTFFGNRANGGPGVGFSADLFSFSPLTINNTLFDATVSSDGGAPMSCQQTNVGSQNLQWPSGKTLGGADPACTHGITYQDPQLGALGAHGGPTQTLVPHPKSPAVGLGMGCPPTDQRGQPRPTHHCTAGAVEGSAQ